MSKSALRPSKRKATDKELLRAYKKTGSVHKAGKILGMCGQSVHERLLKLSATLKFPKFSEQDEQVLKNEYIAFRNAGRLQDLAKKMGRTKQFICRKAKSLGFTDQRTAKQWLRIWKGMPEEEARTRFEEFRKSRLGVGQWCKLKGFDDLGFTKVMQEHFPDEWDFAIEGKASKSLYRLGRAVEYRVRDELRKRGYFVLRSPRSLGPIDLVAIKKGCVLFVQCKRSMALPPAEWNALFEVAQSVDAIPIMAGTPTGRGTVYKRMLGPKDGSKKKQPMQDFTP